MGKKKKTSVAVMPSATTPFIKPPPAHTTTTTTRLLSNTNSFAALMLATTSATTSEEDNEDDVDTPSSDDITYVSEYVPDVVNDDDVTITTVGIGNDDITIGKNATAFVKRVVIQPTYQLTMGKESIVKPSLTFLNNAVDTASSDTLVHELSMSNLNSVSFFGKCFQCQYMSHSQKYCPLRFCSTCQEYGHSETTCQPR